MSWFHKPIRAGGSVLFRGTIPPRPEELEGLERAGITVTRLPPVPTAHYGLRLDHPNWGTALLACARDLPFPPRDMLEHEPGLTRDEVKLAATGGSLLSVMMESPRGHVLRDRKLFLRFLNAVAGSDGLLVMDHAANRSWSRAALDEELAHDADLDITSVHTVHIVRSPDASPEQTGTPSAWLHTHGLDGIGGFDFDILRAVPDVWTRQVDALRAIAFAIVEGKVDRNTTCFKLADPGVRIGFVDAAAFQARAAPSDAAQREHDAEHSTQRAVICEPRRWRWWPGGQCRPARFFMAEGPDEILLQFSKEATELMRQRARQTYGVFRRLHEEFAHLTFPFLVKLGYQIDGGNPDAQEYLWFSVNALADDSIDATLENEPFSVSRLKKGDRGRHPLELLTEWMVFTPAGPITPRDTRAARLLRTLNLEAQAS